MSIQNYKKDSIKTYNYIPKDYIELEEENVKYSQDTNLWNTIGNSYSILQDVVNKNKLANLIIPSFFVFLGLFFIGRHWWPDIQTWAEEQSGILNQGTTSPVSESFIDYSKYISNPAGLDLLAKEAFEQDVLQEDTISKNYRGTFYISIPSIGIDRLPVQANVDSTTEEIYNAALKTSLAHFQNTGLPISKINNNIVIYGHSATSNYNPKTSDPEVAFSFLPQLKVGDDIIIEMEGETFRYKMYRSKIVEPTDISIITGTKNRTTLTLFTCYPAGNNAQRYVAIARPVE